MYIATKGDGASPAHTKFTHLYTQPFLIKVTRAHRIRSPVHTLITTKFKLCLVPQTHLNNVPLDILLHDGLFLLIASTVPCNTDALRLIDVGLGWGWGGGGC